MQSYNNGDGATDQHPISAGLVAPVLRAHTVLYCGKVVHRRFCPDDVVAVKANEEGVVLAVNTSLHPADGVGIEDGIL